MNKRTKKSVFFPLKIKMKCRRIDIKLLESDVCHCKVAAVLEITIMTIET